MQKYLTTKKKQMYNGPPLLNAYLSRGVSTEKGTGGSCQGPGASPVCTYTLDYWYVFPLPSLIHCKFAFYANDFSLRFSYVFFPFLSFSFPFSSHSFVLSDIKVLRFIHQWVSKCTRWGGGGNSYKGLCKIISITNLIILNSLPQPPIDSFHCLSIGF